MKKIVTTINMFTENFNLVFQKNLCSILLDFDLFEKLFFTKKPISLKFQSIVQSEKAAIILRRHGDHSNDGDDILC
jgi:hypothetical protein